MKNQKYCYLKTSITTLLFLFLLSDTLYAQMFSVQEQTPRERATLSYTSLSLGWEVGEFTFTGDQDQADLDRYDFSDGILKVTFENPGIDFYLGLAGGLTGMENRSFVNIGAVLYNNFVLTNSENFWLILPLQINTDLTRVQNDGANRQFQQSAFQVGAGLAVTTRISENLRSTIRIVPGYGFSNSQGAFFGGTIFSAEGKARIIFDNVFGERGLIFGYDFRHRSYNIEPDLYNYDFNGHTFSIGITF
jgi:hypothetical protein